MNYYSNQRAAVFPSDEAGPLCISHQKCACVRIVKSFTSDAIAEIMEDSYIFSEKFMEGLRRVGQGSQFWYRSRFDPLTVNEYRMIVEYESKVDLDDQ